MPQIVKLFLDELFYGNVERLKEKDMKMEITLTITDDRYAKLKDVAKNLHITPEDLVCVSIDELLSRPDKDFLKAVDYVLKKNTELYRRLAQ